MTQDDRVTAENSATEAEKQQGSNWPVPGDEGYVVPDGTPQAAQQLEDNKRAAADRAAAGSAIHGAPAATPGPQLLGEAAAAQKRAEEYSGPTMADREQGVSDSIADGMVKATEKAEASEQDVTPSAAETTTDAKRTADSSKPTTKR